MIYFNTLQEKENYDIPQENQGLIIEIKNFYAVENV